MIKNLQVIASHPLKAKPAGSDNTLQTLEIYVSGIRDETEALRIEQSLERIAGVNTPRVSFANQLITAVIDSRVLTTQHIADILRHQGIQVAVEQKSFPIRGMHCASCVQTAEKAIRKVPQTLGVTVNLANQSALIAYLPSPRTLPMLAEAVRQAGYQLITETTDPVDSQEKYFLARYHELKRRFMISLILTLPVGAASMLMIHEPWISWAQMILTLPVLAWCGRGFFAGAWIQARQFRSNMDTLIATGTGAAFLFSAVVLLFPQGFPDGHIYFETSAMIITLVLFGRLLEERAKQKTRRAVAALMKLRPPKARRITPDGRENEVPVHEILPGDRIAVKPGETIPVDGIVESGASTADESLITGESMPVEKFPSSAVTGGTMNVSGFLIVRTTRTGQDTTLAKIIELVQNAQGSKAPVQKLVDRISAVFVPAILILSILTFLIWYVLPESPSFRDAMIYAVTVLIVACPCALGLATPAAIMVAVGKGAALGLLIRNAESLDHLVSVNTVVFDKTGTVTLGRPEVVSMECINLSPTGSRETVESVLWSMEKRANHPLADAITAYLRNRPGLNDQEISDFENLPGAGVKAIWNNQTVRIGHAQFMINNGIELKDIFPTDASENDARETTIYMVIDRTPVCRIVMADRISASAMTAVKSLKNQGYRTYLLSGDREPVTRAIAGELGMDAYFADIKPDGKAAVIRQLQAAGSRVAMIGDGINDAPALTAADAGIAMGHGADVAIESADVILTGRHLERIVTLFELAKKTRATIRQNLFWAFIYNIIGVPLAAGALVPFFGIALNPMIASAMMAFSSVSVVMNSLRLNKKIRDKVYHD